MPELKPGLAGTAETIVRETNTAIAMGKRQFAGFCNSLHGCPDGTGSLQCS